MDLYSYLGKYDSSRIIIARERVLLNISITVMTLLLLLSGCMATYYGVQWLRNTRDMPYTSGIDRTGRNQEMFAKTATKYSKGSKKSTESSSTNAHTPILIYVESIDNTSALDTPAPTLIFSDKSSTSLPIRLLLENVQIHAQTRNLNCEFQTASDLAAYYGKTITWEEIFLEVGHDPGGNPHKGFVGKSLDDPPGSIYPRGYGVYAEPIARALNAFGLPAKVHYRESAIWLKKQIARGNPVMVWATANMRQSHVVKWKTADGERVKGVRWEHTYLIVGYEERGVWVGDPWDGKRHFYSWKVFLDSWDLFDRMSVVINDTN